MKVELGAGARKQPGWVAVDINPKYADVPGDALHLPFEDGAIDELRAVDVLEHVSYRETNAALTEWARVLKSEGQLYVQVPDAETIFQWFVTHDDRLRRMDTGDCSLLDGAQWRLLGGHDDGNYADAEEGDDWRWNAHYSLWSKLALAEALRVAGFHVERLEVNGHPNLCCTAAKK